MNINDERHTNINADGKNKSQTSIKKTKNMAGKFDKKQTLNGYQTGIKQVSNRYQTDIETGIKQVSNGYQTGIETGIKTGIKQVSNRYQTGDKQVSKDGRKSHSIVHLVGTQRSLVFLLYLLTKENFSQTTKPVTLNHISKALKTEKSTLKQAIMRLQKKGCLVRNSSKTGRCGWSSFTIPSELYQEIIQYERQGFFSSEFDEELLQTGIKRVSNGYQTGDETGDETGDKRVSNAPIVYSSNKTTTIIQEEFNQLDLSPLHEFGFDRSHVYQIAAEYKNNPEVQLPLSIIQDSINAMAFDLKHNNVAKDFKMNPVIALLSMLKKGKPYSSVTPGKFVSPQQEAMSLYLASKERQVNEQLATEEKIKSIEFLDWQSKLPEEELLSLCPESELDKPGLTDKLRRTMRYRMAKEYSRSYFDIEIWPAKKAQVLKLAASMAESDTYGEGQPSIATAKQEEARYQQDRENKFIAWEKSLSDSEKMNIAQQILHPRMLIDFSVDGFKNLEIKNSFLDYFKTKILTSTALPTAS
jgi:hypothetical protein